MAEWFLLNKVECMVYLHTFYHSLWQTQGNISYMEHVGGIFVSFAGRIFLTFQMAEWAVRTPENARHVWPSQMSGGRKLALRRRRHILALRPKRQFHQQVVSYSNSFIYCAAMQFIFAVYKLYGLYILIWHYVIAFVANVANHFHNDDFFIFPGRPSTILWKVVL